MTEAKNPAGQGTAPTGRTGVVLAAGLGTRLRSDSANDLKPLTLIAGVPLIYRTLHSLERAGCDRIVVVLGFNADELRGYVLEGYEGDAEVIFAVNEAFHLKNGVSVLTARPFVSDTFVLVMADHVLGDEVMDLARDHAPPAQGATLLVDYKLDTIFDMDDATKVWADDGRITRIGKQLTAFNCVDTGVFLCTTALMDELERVYESQGDVSLSDGVGALATSGRMHVLDIGDGFWQDVDTPEMLVHAREVLQRRQADAAGS